MTGFQILPSRRPSAPNIMIQRLLNGWRFLRPQSRRLPQQADAPACSMYLPISVPRAGRCPNCSTGRASGHGSVLDLGIPDRRLRDLRVLTARSLVFAVPTDKSAILALVTAKSTTIAVVIAASLSGVNRRAADLGVRDRGVLSVRGINGGNPDLHVGDCGVPNLRGHNPGVRDLRGSDLGVADLRSRDHSVLDLLDLTPESGYDIVCISMRE